MKSCRMLNFNLFLIALLNVLFFLAENVNGRGAGECASICNDLRFEVLTLEICRDAKRTLPRPKVGDFCSSAMEQGFSDACIALCMEQQPVPRVAQTCRAAAIEMPRPTVRRWCEHGYNAGFSKTMKELYSHFTPEETAVEEERELLEEEPIDSNQDGDLSSTRDSVPSIYNDASQSEKTILATIPVTLENDETKNLIVYEGQDAEEAVVDFCRVNVPNEVSTCIRHLLDLVVEKLAEVNSGDNVV